MSHSDHVKFSSEIEFGNENLLAFELHPCYDLIMKLMHVNGMHFFEVGGVNIS